MQKLQSSQCIRVINLIMFFILSLCLSAFITFQGQPPCDLPVVKGICLHYCPLPERPNISKFKTQPLEAHEMKCQHAKIKGGHRERKRKKPTWLATKLYKDASQTTALDTAKFKQDSSNRLAMSNICHQMAAQSSRAQELWPRDLLVPPEHFSVSGWKETMLVVDEGGIQRRQ